MYNAKSDESRDRKGSISYTLGDKGYFGSGSRNIFNKNASYYGNTHLNIFKKSK
jgi:hypothetical protein